MHVQGAVILDATISREGNISNLKLVKGDQVLAHAAIEAVRQWRYKPYYLNGKPVEVQTQITINFKLPN
jgi:protein TonB